MSLDPASRNEVERTSLRVIHWIAGLVVLFGLPALVAIFVYEAGDGGGRIRLRGARTVVLVSLDGTTPRELQRYCLQGTAMPALGSFAKDATWFDRHWSQCNGTNAATTSLLTGHYPRNHGVGSLRDVGRVRG